MMDVTPTLGPVPKRPIVGPRQMKALIRDDYDAVGPLWEPWMARYFQFPARRLVADLRPRPGHRCLDIACGSGVVARTFAAIVGPQSVTACDISPRQVRAAREVLSASGLGSIRVDEMDAECLAYPATSFDRIGCGFGVNHFPRPAAALRGAFRVLAPGGRAGFSVWLPSPWVARNRVEERLTELLPAAGEDERRCTAVLDRAFARNSRPDHLAALMERAGFARVSIRRHALVVDFVDAPTLVDTVLAREERALRQAALDLPARARLRDALLAVLGDLGPRAYRVRRRYVTILGVKPL
jgi:ubiquinone/menaquinone biosynthesis C-methylase UbiE